MPQSPIEIKANRNLITFFVSKMLTSLGFTVFSFGISLYILALTGSALSFATNIVFNVLPRALAAPFAGYVADRFSKKKIVILSMTGITLSVVSLIVYTALYGMSVYAIYTITAIFSTIGAFNGVAFSSAIPSLVGKNRIQKAMSFNQISYSIGGIGGPVIGGMLYGFVSMQVFLIIMASAYFIALLLEASMNFTLFEVPLTKKKESMSESMKQGWAYLQTQPIVKSLLWMNLSLNFFASAISVGVVFILVEKLDIASNYIGMIQGCGAVGMLIASIYLSMKRQMDHAIPFIKKSALGVCFFMALLALPLFFDFTQSMYFLYYSALLLCLSAMTICTNTPIGVMIQKYVDDEYRGRVFGIIETISIGSGPIGALLFGLLFDFVDARILLIIVAVSLASLLLLFMSKIEKRLV
ncbi:MFS transporter [Kurthia sibirica]|uniref:MFS transporter n=1 Tax=Kurthia sibirica TaxID=202750 RepID=A0A2U3AKK3_9BACL|nr:MFS transporter [Kurthia sibirica]PWI25066.1 MFS transporter [Kurthia sibirica]GEK34232.1 MFS transporter [Kurthia sibirica]